MIADGIDGLELDYDFFAQFAHTIGDIDNDGIPDILAASPRSDGGGAIIVCFLRRNGSMRAY